MKNWKRLTPKEISEKIFDSLTRNANFNDEKIIGVPGSYLDRKVFNDHATFLKEAPFLTSLLHNPNHIGCHTLGESESFFEGSHSLERQVIRICAEDIMQGEENGHDGYIASGGTEANIQAVWIYRNYFFKTRQAKPGEVAILASTDTHYSVYKAANILNIPLISIAVDSETRAIKKEDIHNKVSKASSEGIKNFIVIANMMTTMFGSVDNISAYTNILKANKSHYKIHVDAAYGGFIYPFSSKNRSLTFQNPEVSSITMDAHKKLQAPYGTGIFLIRKGLMKYAQTEEASYVQGLDSTLSGSRSGANAIAVWMILMSYGPFGWYEKIQNLISRTNWLCEKLSDLNIHHFRFPESNIVTIKASQIDPEVAKTFGLVPDVHYGEPGWFKIVVMEHVTPEAILRFLEKIGTELIA